MKTSEMIRLNNELREKLTPENETYYGDILVYIRSSNVPQHKAEELLLEILEHLIQAQEEGRSAFQVFGEDPKAYSEEIVRSLPRTTWATKVKRSGYIVLVALTWTFFIHGLFGLLTYIPTFPLKRESFMLSPGMAFSYFIVPLLMVPFTFMLIRKTLFAGTKAKKKTALFYLLFGLFFAGTIFLTVVFDRFFTKNFPNWKIELGLAPGYSFLLFLLGFVTYKYVLRDLEI